jgi:2-polyprenyl-6-methoxyphenol hydroxylase-like FAD-dependent oxidoreductase
MAEQVDITSQILDSQQTSCCIVGGGPGGMILALLLARQGVRVTLLEAHKDFDREFRGDTIHPSILEILDEIGLAEPLHQLRHVKIYGPTIRTANTPFTPIDFRRLKTRFPYIMLIPQTKFLEFLAAKAKKYPEFSLRMVANVETLIEEEGEVRGVRYLGTDGWHEVRALLTVGADGRFSKVRRLAGFEPIKSSPPMDILWFRLPHLPGDDSGEDPGRVRGGLGRGRLLGVIDRFDYWQVAYIFPKGGYQELRAAGLESLRRSILEIDPRLARHVGLLTEWHQLSLLSVEASCCRKWFKPGLLLIGRRRPRNVARRRCGHQLRRSGRSGCGEPVNWPPEGWPNPARRFGRCAAGARMADPGRSGDAIGIPEANHCQCFPLSRASRSSVVRSVVLPNPSPEGCARSNYRLWHPASAREIQDLERLNHLP